MEHHITLQLAAAQLAPLFLTRRPDVYIALLTADAQRWLDGAAFDACLAALFAVDSDGNEVAS